MNRNRSPSSSSPRRSEKYEVFVSFRGEDSRNKFTDHLFAALRRKGLLTFKDDVNLKQGDSIASNILKAIEESRIFIVVFSKNFANSIWCLDELAKISEIVSEPGYSVLPVFYDVDSSDVRKQSHSYEKAFAKHEQRFILELDKVQRWRLALTQVVSLSGWDVRDKPESTIIDEIVKDVISKLGHKFSSLAGDLAGIQPRVEALEKLMDLGSDDVVRVVGIWGMGGIGKTTLAALLYDKISHQFDACCFLADVSKVSIGSGLIRLQEQILCEVLEENQKIWDEHTGTNLISSRLRHLKTLIVIDNVDQSEQLEKLAGKSVWFGAGSRIIITSRDKHILREHGVDEVYKVELLNQTEALQLFCRIAFKSDYPMRGYEELTSRVLKYCKALPLAIKVLGSLLFQKNESQWRSELARLQKNPNKEIMEVLRGTFNSLEEKEKELFLDIACFLKGEEVNYAMKFLYHCGFDPVIGIRILLDKSLRSIDNGTIWMHDMLQKLGQEIVRQESTKELGKRSRLWFNEDFRHVMEANTGTKSVEAIVLNLEDLQQTPLRAKLGHKFSSLANDSTVQINHNSTQSSSSSLQTWKHDVFLSFRGEDTGKSFTDHLFAALRRKGIFTFRDDIKLNKGDSISPALLKAIEQCRISIVVFSKNYANSTWCLEELEKISRGINEPGYTVLPIFYDVDPSEVRKQSQNYEKAFTEHEQRFILELDKVQRWRLALTQVANLPGWHVRDEPESKIMDEIVDGVISKLGYKFSRLPDDLVGIQPRLEALEKLLDLGSDDIVRVVGIWGMGGIGKTTLARLVYDWISHQFDACCFLADVSEVSKREGLIRLQEQLLCETLKKNLKIWDKHTGTNLIRSRLRRRKTLIVIDHVDQSEQLEKLVGKSVWFGAGSRIIITSRDKYILRKHGVDEVYEVELLNKTEDLQLFCRNAFKSDYPMRGYEELTSNVLEYAKGLPLAIKLLASFLFNRSVSEWRSALAKLQKFPYSLIGEKLRESFDGLHNMEKRIFLDIACFFIGEKINYVKEILCHCGIDPHFGIEVLIEKSVITISDQRIQMHALVQQLGQEIVRQESPIEPGKRSRLWLVDDFRQVMETNTGTENVEAIVLNLEDLQETPLRAEALSKMTSLELLIMRNLKFLGDLNGLSNNLRYISWDKYPFTCLPSSFEPFRLVELIMLDSSITQLWEGVKILPNLRIMDLRGLKNLIKTPDFTGLPNLEKLDLEGCTRLLQVDPSIVFLPKLTFFNLRDCASVVSIPNSLFGLSSLKILNLAGCSKLAECLNFDSLRSSIEVTLAKMSCFLFISLPEDIKSNKFVFCCLICLIYSIWMSNGHKIPPLVR